MLKNFRRSLTDLVGEDYINHVCAASSALTGESEAALRAVADAEVDCCPSWYIDRQEALMQRIGETIAPAYESSLPGADGGVPRGAGQRYRAAGRVRLFPRRRRRAALLCGQERALSYSAGTLFPRLCPDRARQADWRCQRHA
jgi:hypothetical protein